MRLKCYPQLLVCIFVLLQHATAQPPANRSLSNLASVAINTSLVPQVNNNANLGSSLIKWKNVYLYNLVFSNGTIQTTAFTPYTAGAGISISSNSIINTAPDKVVSLTAGSGIAVSGTYPNFNISSTASSAWLANGSSVYCNGGNVGIGTNTPAAKFEVAGGDALINGITVGYGHAGSNTNLAVGLQALYTNTDGFANIAYGPQALYSNTTGYDNSAIGDHALFSNIDGIENTAMGNGTLYYNVSGYGNCAVGNGALLNNGAVPNTVSGPDASYNTATGFWSMFNSTSGSNNAAYGTGTLSTNTTGSFNTALGAYSDVAEEALNNATAIGTNSLVNASNKIRLGDVNVTVVESAAGSWTTSDGRFKNNVKENVVGLSFIKLLRPVTYHFDANKFDAFLSQRLPDSVKQKRTEAFKKVHSKAGSILQTGFIAQEVNEAAKKAGYDFNGVHVPENATDNYSISYEKMVVPLVKAVQELAQQNEEMKKQIASLETKLAAVTTTDVKQNISLSSVSLQQNIPNPSGNNTSISYYVPAGSRYAELLITDKQGKNIKKIQLQTTGTGVVEVNTAALAAGTYQYSLLVNGTVADTKQMTVLK